MSFDLEINRGRFLNARLGVNGIQNAARSLGISARAAGLCILSLQNLIGFLNNAPRALACPVAALFAPF
jgi:hypothetical protein